MRVRNFYFFVRGPDPADGVSHCLARTLAPGRPVCECRDGAVTGQHGGPGAGKSMRGWLSVVPTLGYWFHVSLASARCLLASRGCSPGPGRWRGGCLEGQVTQGGGPGLGGGDAEVGQGRAAAPSGCRGGRWGTATGRQDWRRCSCPPGRQATRDGSWSASVQRRRRSPTGPAG
jgi:hypothetical protein